LDFKIILDTRKNKLDRDLNKRRRKKFQI